MKLVEAFAKYPNDVKLRRKSFENNFPPDVDKEKLEEYLKDGNGAHTIEWLKGMHAWGNKECRKMGFWIPDFMIADANTDDWEVFE